MKKLIAFVLILLGVLTPAFAFAQLNTQQGGTGVSGVSAGSILFGSTPAIRMATSSNLQWSASLNRLLLSAYNATNGTTTNATSTNLFATLASSTSLYLATGGCTGSNALQVSSAGLVNCGAVSGTGGAFPFTATTNYGQVVYATSTPTLWFQSGFFASSTSYLVYASTTALTVTGDAYVDGMLGVGTNNPQTQLHVASDSGGSLRLQRTNASFLATWDIVPSQSAAGDLAFMDRLVSANRLTITAAGNVGIGSTTPTIKLSVMGGGLFNRDVGADYFLSTSTTIANVFPLASSTQLSVASQTFYIDSSGRIQAKDTTNNWSGVVSPTRYFVLGAATSSASWTGTTTAEYVPSITMPFAGTLRNVQCTASTTAAFFGTAVYVNQTLVSPTYFVASSTEGNVLFTADNTFARGDVISAYFGTTTAQAANRSVSCTFGATETY